MPTQLHVLPLDQPALPSLAGWLLSHREGQEPHALAETLVLLPSHRACEQLRHALLDAAETRSLLLPWITTPSRLASELADFLGLESEHLPADELRSLLLAPRLSTQSWLAERPEAAPGLAAELIEVFDDVRKAGCEDRVLEGTHDDDLMSHVEDGGEAVLASDLEYIRQGWRLYR